jgi:predicted MFS family arabinose efflux permease
VSPEAKRTLALAMLATAVAQSFGRFTWALLLPAIEDDLLGSYGRAGTLGTANVGAYLAGTALVSALSGRLAPSVLIRSGLVMSTTGLTILTFAHGFWTLLLGLVITGTAGAFIWIPAPSFAAAAMDPRQRGFAMGFVSSGVGLGIFFSGQLTNIVRLVLGSGSWRPIWAIEAAIGAIALVLALRWLRDDPETSGTSRLRLGALKAVPGWLALTLSYGLYGLGYAIYVNYVVAALEDDAGFSPGHASFVYGVLGFAIIFGGFILGRMSDVYGRRLVIALGTGIMAVAAIAPLTGTEPVVTPTAFVFGIMFSGIPALNAAKIRDHLDARSFGAAFGAVTLAFGVGQVIGPQLGGWIADSTGHFDLVFVVSAGTLLASAVAAWFLPADRVLSEPDPAAR